MINGETARMLSDLPEDVQAMGWRFVLRDSRPYPVDNPRWYIAVYTRSFDPDIDDDRFPGVIEGSTLRVSTNSKRSASWEAARRDAIAWMRFLDDQRRVPGA